MNLIDINFSSIIISSRSIQLNTNTNRVLKELFLDVLLCRVAENNILPYMMYSSLPLISWSGLQLLMCQIIYRYRKNVVRFTFSGISILLSSLFCWQAYRICKFIMVHLIALCL